MITSILKRSVLVLAILSATAAGAAHAQPAPQPQPQPAPQPEPSPQWQPSPPAQPQWQPGPQPQPQWQPSPTLPSTSAEGTPTPPPDSSQPKQPKAGDFDAGGQVRLPNGPDETGKFATYNWIAVDLKGRYLLARSISVNANIPLAIIKPDMLMDGTHPKMIGGVTARLEAKLPRMPQMPGMKQDTDIGIALTVAYMHQGALMLSDKDYPLFTGNFEPGLTAGPIAKVKLSTLVDFSTMPVFVFQAGGTGHGTAVQIPASLILRLGSLIQVSTDLGVYTGDDFSFGAKDGGRIAAGGSLTVKIGPIIAHAGGGVASLLTGGIYPTIGDSVYVDLNVKYAK